MIPDFIDARARLMNAINANPEWAILANGTEDRGGIKSIQSDKKFERLCSGVWAQLINIDKEYGHPEHTTRALIAYGKSLTITWKGLNVMVDRIVRNYIKSNPEPIPDEAPAEEPQPAPEPEEEPKEEPKEEPQPEPEPVKEEDSDSTDDYIKPKEYEEVKALLAMGLNVYLYGPPGTGKTTMAEHISKSLRGDYELSACIKDATSQVSGFLDANGTFHDTSVTRAMKRGLPLILDELDTGYPEEIGALNSVASHGEITPPGCERIKAVDGFQIVACGNTRGRGGDSRYPNAVKMNDAFMDRFELVYVGYDENIDLAVAKGDAVLVSFINEWRNVCLRKGIPSFCPSYRIEGSIAKRMARGHALDRILIQSFLAKMNVDGASLATILKDMQGRNKYVNTLRTILEDIKSGKLEFVLDGGF